MPLPIGTRIGPYEITGWIGAGGMGEVYRARDPRLGRDVAIKLLPDTLATDRARLHRFEQEARAVGQLNHPNILAVFDVGTHEGAPYLVSELLEGESLRSRLQRGPIAPRKAVDYARQTADGLAAAHDKGIVHRDLKPDNLFVTSDERIKILDFGIAKLMRADDEAVAKTGFPTETETGFVVGTQGYMSPEQVRGENVDPRSDLFSFGAILYEMLSGRPAFLHSTGAETMAAILKEDPPAPAGTDVSPALARIITRCLEKSREARFQSARDLAFGLEVLSGTHASSASLLAEGQPRRWRTAFWVAVAVLILVTALAGWLTWRVRTIDDQWAAATFTRVTDFEGSEQDGAISPDGRFIAFMSDREGAFHVWLNQVGTGDFKNLTPGAPDQRNPGMSRGLGFSSDGSVWINGSPSNKTRLRVVPLLGGAPRTFLGERVANVAWSRDGKRLAYFTQDRGDPIFVADATGDNARQIYIGKQDDQNREHNHFLAWSVDDKWIFFAHGIQGGSEYDVWRIPSVEGDPEQLTHLRSAVEYITPIDDRWVLFVAPDQDRGGPWLWALDLKSMVPHRISTGLERYLSVAAAADGHRLVASVSNPTASLWSVPILDRVSEERDVRLYPLKASRALSPRFAGRSSSALFYLSSSGSGDGLWRLLQDGTTAEIWKSDDVSLSEPPAISRDGRRVALVVRNHDQKHLSIMSADGTDAHVRAPSIDVRGTPDWSNDDLWIVTGGVDAKGSGLFKIRTDDGASERLVDGPAFDPVWSPDGALIVYTGQQTANAPLRAVRPDGSPVTLPDIRVPFGAGGHGRSRFLPSGKGLVYVQNPVGSQQFWLLDLATNKTQPIARLSSSATMFTFDITPDGKQIVFDRVWENSNIRRIDLR